MLETQININDYQVTGESGELRPVDWNELVARFAASRELRSMMARRKSPSSGNFVQFSNVSVIGINENKPAVNLNILADGKHNGGNSLSSAVDAEQGDREKI